MSDRIRTGIAAIKKEYICLREPGTEEYTFSAVFGDDEREASLKHGTDDRVRQAPEHFILLISFV